MSRLRVLQPLRPLAGLLAVLGAALGACYPGPVDPVGISPPPEGLVRLPYVQHVTDSSAWVLWMPDENTADSAWFRVPGPDSAWTAVPVGDHIDGTRRARLAPLPAESEIEYRIVSGQTSVGPVAFTTSPPAGRAAEEPVRVLLFGDSGWGGAAQLELARQMAVRQYDLAIHVGDIAYDDGSREDFTLRHFDVYRYVFDAVPFYPSVGNHDVRADAGVSYDAAFIWPEPFPGARYFTFRWGAIQFISIDTSSKTADVEGLRSSEGRQYEWLEATLREASSDPSVQWIVTFMHHPIISHAIGISGHEPDRNIRRSLGPLFERYGVDLVTAGHDHHYERTWPVANGRRVEPGCGPVHVLSGGGGASRYARDVRGSPLMAFGARVYQFVDLRIGADRLEGSVVDRDGAVIDEFSVRPFPGTAAGLPERCSE